MCERGFGNLIHGLHGMRGRFYKINYNRRVCVYTAREDVVYGVQEEARARSRDKAIVKKIRRIIKNKRGARACLCVYIYIFSFSRPIARGPHKSRQRYIKNERVCVFHFPDFFRPIVKIIYICTHNAHARSEFSM